jgi:sulfofructose kinase
LSRANQRSTPRVFVVGSAVVDFVFATDIIPTEAKKYRASQAEVVGGGCAANAAVSVSRLGGDAVLGARLGQDQLGDLIVADLKTEGVDTSQIQRSANGVSSFSSICVDQTGERQLMNFRGSGLCEETYWIDKLPKFDAVLADTRWPEASLAALEKAREWNVPGILDGEPPVDSRLLETASHIAFSRDGLLSVTSETDMIAGVSKLSSHYNAWVCVTDGENGTYFARDGETGHTPAFSVEVVDTLGAGDIWHGAFALALAEGLEEANAVRFASATAALKCTTFGGRKGCPDRATVESFLKENL